MNTGIPRNENDGVYNTIAQAQSDGISLVEGHQIRIKNPQTSASVVTTATSYPISGTSLFIKLDDNNSPSTPTSYKSSVLDFINTGGSETLISFYEYEAGTGIGGGTWKFTGTTEATGSPQTPQDRDVIPAEFRDVNGKVWVSTYLDVISFESFNEMKSNCPSIPGAKVKTKDRNAEYEIKGSSYSELPGDAALQSGSVCALSCSDYWVSTWFGFSVDNTAEVNSYAYQDAVNRLILIGGGRVHTPAGNYKLKAIYDNDRTNPPSGYVPSDEMRRANKAVIIYEADHIELTGDEGTIFDRSEDNAIDPLYAEYSSTIYVSKSSRITIRGIEGLGYQEDLPLYNDVKTGTSGAHILINNGCDDITLEDIKSQDGTNSIAVGINRTGSSQSIDPNLADCTNVKLKNISCTNGEHGILLAACDGVHLSDVNIGITERNGIKAALQRGLFIHSARNVSGSNVRISGVFKTPINISDYRDVYNINIDKIIIDKPVTGAEYFTYTGSNYNLTFQSIGVRLSTQNGNKISNVSLNGLGVDDYASGVRMANSNLSKIKLNDIDINTHFVGVDTIDYREGPTTAIAQYGLSMSGSIVVAEDLTNWPAATPLGGISLDTVSTSQAKGLNIDNLTVRAQNRNGRITNWDGCIFGGEFTYQAGLSTSARVYDLNASLGSINIYGTEFGTQGRPNKGDDTPALADTENVLFDLGGVRNNILKSTTPDLARELNAELTNDSTLTLKVKGEDGVVRQISLSLT